MNGAGEGRLTGAEAILWARVAEDVAGYVPGVGQAADVGDLVAVVGRDQDLGDAFAGLEQLDDHLGIEVEAVVVAVKGHVAKGGHRVGPVPRVPLEAVPATAFSSRVRIRLPTNL